MARNKKPAGFAKLLSRKVLLHALLALFTISQIAPAGATVAREGDEFLFVMCTAEGAKSVSWEEATGEPSPFGSPSHDDEQTQGPCRACASGACGGAKLNISEVFLPSVFLMTPIVEIEIAPPVFARVMAGPPMPSRAPPLS